jgi:hypothetical protein
MFNAKYDIKRDAFIIISPLWFIQCILQGNLDIYLFLTCQFHFACIHLYDEINLHPQVVNKIIDGK